MNNSNTNPQGQWLQLKAILKLYQIGRRKLFRWEACGYVRSLKLGTEKRDTKLFYVPDIHEALMRLSAGLKPKIRHGKIK